MFSKTIFHDKLKKNLIQSDVSHCGFFFAVGAPLGLIFFQFSSSSLFSRFLRRQRAFFFLGGGLALSLSLLLLCFCCSLCFCGKRSFIMIFVFLRRCTCVCSLKHEPSNDWRFQSVFLFRITGNEMQKTIMTLIF
ncbi:hypothetical protein ABB37_07705 [Leptomonas pyrrhocoris]|uniref:Transmembrane protein n=1 Tax=Leptomonas pyrrhocoris TaxID=157538 RepID=A0A0N0VDX0_LEPPY|nr:hypothetical protein ABB37_07705 [Leptomonas pyrrhocoris]KPA76358.1 hypothetical protein ABB37_07705 [Leptomonas pyrrhocoris]|eukprot:XP_015654797.1 hypothetical protein ABB37_07705 [Leptomonas pyrrhocoris]